MTYINNLQSYTNLTTPSTPYAATPSVVCDFGWYGVGGQIFGSLIYDVAGNTYPPPPENDVRSDYNTVIADYITEVNNEVIFDCLDSLSLGLPHLIVPNGVNVIEYAWDFGTGFTALGPVVSTTYTQPTPDGACTLTITDNLGRVTRTTKRLNFVDLNPLQANASGRYVGT